MAVSKVTVRGQPMWRAQVRVDGKRRTAFRRSKQEALAAEAQLRLCIDEGGGGDQDPSTSDQKNATQASATIADLVEDFLAFQGSAQNRRPNRDTTLVELRGTLRRYILPRFSDMRPADIDARSVDAFAAMLAAPKIRGGAELSKNSVANVLGALRRLLVVCERWGLLSKVPEINTRKEKPDQIDAQHFLDFGETDAFLAAAGEWRTLWLFALRTGVRVGELVALQWPDIDLDAGQVHVRRTWTHGRLRKLPQGDRFTKTKSGRARTVPLSWDVREALAALPHHGLLVFGDGQVPLNFKRLRRIGQRIAKRAGIGKPFTTHMTRHSWASACVMRGIPTRTVQVWGGWANLERVEVYSHLAPDHQREQIERLAPPRLAVVHGGRRAAEVGTNAGTNRNEKGRRANAGRP